MSKPRVDIAIVGFQKAGTTSILKYLAQQEGVYAHVQKEMTFFSVDKEYKEGWEQATKRYFPNFNFDKKLLVKHATLIRHESSIKHLHEHNPEAKVIVCLRDPVQRAYSSYLMEKANGSPLADFKTVIEEAFENHHRGNSDWRYNVFVKLGEYVNYIDSLTKYFNKDSIYILQIEDFHQNRKEEFAKLCAWLGIENPVITVVDNQHNSYKVAKSGWLSKMISNSLVEGSVTKKIFRKIIPLKRQATLGDTIRNLGKKEGIKEPLDAESKLFLEQHFAPYDTELKVKYSIK